MRFFRGLALLLGLVLAASAAGERVLRTSGEGRLRTLDPIQADDPASRNICGAIFDTLVEYDYLARPYRLVPSMLAEMPTHNRDFTEYRFKLRPDLCFAAAEGLPPEPVTPGLGKARFVYRIRCTRPRIAERSVRNLQQVHERVA